MVIVGSSGAPSTLTVIGIGVLIVFEWTAVGWHISGYIISISYNVIDLWQTL